VPKCRRAMVDPLAPCAEGGITCINRASSAANINANHGLDNDTTETSWNDVGRRGFVAVCPSGSRGLLARGAGYVSEAVSLTGLRD